MPPTDDLGFIHKFVPATPGTLHPVTLLLLHGTGGDENDLLPLGEKLWPGAALLGVRGKVEENGMPRFFRRFAEGVFDVKDLKFRTEELAQFIEAASVRYSLNTKKLIAVGYSNGANIAASLILLHPHDLAAAVAEVTSEPRAPLPQAWAGRAGASAPDWPAHACMRSMSLAFTAASRMACVSPRCTG